MKKFSFDEVKEKSLGFCYFFREMQQIISTPVNYDLVHQLVKEISSTITNVVKDEAVKTFLQLPVSKKGEIVHKSFIQAIVKRGLKDALNLNGVTAYVLNMEKEVLEKAGIELSSEFLLRVVKEVPELNGIRNDGEFEGDGYLMIMVSYNYKLPFTKN